MPRISRQNKELCETLAENLLNAIPVFPRQLIRPDMFIKASGMPLSWIQVLVAVRNKDLSIGELSDQLHIAKPNITPLVDALSQLGLVERCDHEGDRRMVDIRLTEAGRSKLTELTGILQSQVDEHKKKLTVDDMAALSAAFKTIVAIA